MADLRKLFILVSPKPDGRGVEKIVTSSQMPVGIEVGDIDLSQPDGAETLGRRLLVHANLKKAAILVTGSPQPIEISLP